MTTPLLTSIRTVADSMFNSRQLERILVTVRHPATGEIVQIGHDRHTPGLTLTGGYAMVTEPVLIAGRQVGQIELHATSSLRAAHLLQLAQSLHDEITQAIAA